jgi:DNA-binding CsgD family transcriptional regulator
VRARPKGCPLTQREWEALQLVEEGLTYGQIAERLRLSQSTVRAHMHTARKKLGACRAAQAIVKMRAADWYPEAPPVVEPEEGPLSPAQKAYLAVFDRHLKAWAAGDERAEIRTRRQMRWMLHGIYVEADRRLPDEAAENSRMAA